MMTTHFANQNDCGQKGAEKRNLACGATANMVELAQSKAFHQTEQDKPSRTSHPHARMTTSETNLARNATMKRPPFQHRTFRIVGTDQRARLMALVENLPIDAEAD